MYYLTYLGSFVTGMSKRDITTSETCENRLRFKTLEQAEKRARKYGWFHSITIWPEEE